MIAAIKDFYAAHADFFGSFSRAGLVLFVIIATILSANFFRRVFNRVIERTSILMRVSVNQYAFIKHLGTAMIYICGIGLAVYLIPPLRTLSFSIFAGSGILAVVIGFASQHSLANIVSGVFITIFKPFIVGDRVKLLGKEISGQVEDITLRHTVIRTFENKRVLVPNSVISTELVENSSIIDERICRFIEIGISYSSDLDLAMKIMQEEALKHPDVIDARNDEEKKKHLPVVIVRVIGFGESSVNLRANVWAKDQPTAFQVACDLYRTIKMRFDREGIEIPYPHRTVIHKEK